LADREGEEMATADRSEIAPPEVVAELARAFEEAAIPVGLMPTVVNRFMLSPLTATHPVLVFGGGAAGRTPAGHDRIFAKAFVAVTFEKNLAVDLLLHLEKVYAISEQDRAEGIARNQHLFGAK
jgi:hypothetical protein